MLRLLVASDDEVIVNEVTSQLQNEFAIESCGSGKWALELLRTFVPDILLLDARLTDLDCISVLRGLRASGKPVGTICISAFLNDYTIRQMIGLNVDTILPKPCRASLLLSHIRSLGAAVKCPDDKNWHVDFEIDNILLDLGFRMGPDRNRFVKQAILVKYADCSNMLMKQLYLEVARTCNGNVDQVEKAIRDSIKVAWKNGERSMWNLLFTPRANAEKPYPTNEEFITRIAASMRKQARLKPAYKELPAKIV